MGVENFSDYNASSFGQPGVPGQQNIIPTYRAGAGIDYIHCFNQNYGLQTGLYYSGVGQKYSGLVSDYYNKSSNADSPSINYTSHVYMDYIRIPFMLRFNSVMEDNDRINLSVFMGFQLGYLLNVSAYTNPGAPSDTVKQFLAQNPHFNLKQLYNTFDFGLTAGAQLNFKIRDWEYAHIGVRFDRSITDIENLNYVLPENAPVEYLYPVSTKKETRESHYTILTDYASQYIALNVYVGMSFRVKTIIPPKHVIRDDDNSPAQ